MNSATTGFWYDGADVLAELSGSTPTATYIRSLSIDEPFIRKLATGDELYQTDALGSALTLTDGSGASSTTYTQQPLGKTNKSGTSTNAFQYTGREEDGTGVMYYRARYYSAVLNRFIGEDPIGQRGGDTNLYAYVGNNPVSFADPSGLCKDPGGSGIRYCVDSFIPAETVWGFKGDNRGPNPDGGRFRMRLLLNQKFKVIPGDSCFAALCREAIISDQYLHIQHFHLGGRKSNLRRIFLGMRGSHGLFFGAAPDAKVDAIIDEDSEGNARVSAVMGTEFPSIEIWQYGGPSGVPNLLFHYDQSTARTTPLSLFSSPSPIW